jgi:hypothetical protein
MRATRIVVAVGMALLSNSWSPGTVSIYLSAADLAASAPLVVEGTVSRTASGFDPATGTLSTYVTVDVGYVHRGPSDLDRVVIREPGGRFGGLVNEVDAVPVFEPGERVFLFLEPARDGALRVAGMFFGKFVLLEPGSGGARVARRDLSGEGTIAGRSSGEFEELPAGHLESLVAATPHSGPARRRLPGAMPAQPTSGASPPGTADGWTAEPPELGRLEWDEVRVAASAPSSVSGPAPSSATGGAAGDDGASAGLPARRAAEGVRPGGETIVPQFVPLSVPSPARWQDSDNPTPMTIQIQPTGNPLNDATAAANEMKRGMAAWTNVPEARIVLQAGNESYDFTGTNAQSPAAAFPPVNIILFNDPYNEISDPSGCSGVLAMGGYWRSGTVGRTVNNVAFYPIVRQYLIFNNNFQCFLGNPDNLAEVAAHELGHGIGFGHSTVADAIMRASAYGNGRGPRLGNDDRDAAHCFYPHTLTVTSPAGGESWPAGSLHWVDWTVTPEAGPDPGTVDLEYSVNSGLSWTVIGAGEPNDGVYAWTVPSFPGSSC